jgi:ATP dependent DNA ligase-like protein
MEVSAARYEPMPLVRRRDAFDDSAWLFELKWDGWRSLAYVNGTGTALVSRKGNRFRSFPDLASIMPLEVNADDAVLDGEIVKLDGEDRPGFVDLCGAEAPSRSLRSTSSWSTGKTFANSRLPIGRESFVRSSARRPLPSPRGSDRPDPWRWTCVLTRAPRKPELRRRFLDPEHSQDKRPC